MNDCSLTPPTLILHGELTKATTPELFNKLEKTDLTGCTGLDLRAVEKIDTAGVALHDYLVRRLGGPKVVQVEANHMVRQALNSFSGLLLPQVERPHRPGFWEGMGEMGLLWWQNMVSGVLLTADVFWWAIVGLRSSKGRRKGTVVAQGVLMGVDSLPIVGLLSFIIGVILALQGAIQLRQFGADVFLANLLSFTMVREMGPLITAIIVAGRSGSAVAAEIATMTVTEEIDALKMMAINPVRYVVVPKFYAISYSLPLLSVFSIIIGMVGGLIVGVSYLNLSPTGFLHQSLTLIKLDDILLSLAKSLVFAWIIVIVGAWCGFKVEGGAEGVGKATTASVVASIFAVIVADALFSFLYI